MKHNARYNGFWLLPNYFKKVGWFVLGLGISPVLVGLGAALFGYSRNDVFGNIGADTIDHLMEAVSLAGLYILFTSAEPVEDERMMLARTKAMSSTFLSFIVLTVLAQLLAIFDPVAYVTGATTHIKGIFDSPTRLIFFLAIQHFMFFRFLKDAEQASG